MLSHPVINNQPLGAWNGRESRAIIPPKLQIMCGANPHPHKLGKERKIKNYEAIKSNPKLEILKTGMDGGFGILHMTGLRHCSVIWSFGGGWEHVSVCPRNRTPDWNEMCQIKDMFWDGDECVVQYHPVKSEYVNNMKNCLHLWKPINQDLPMPPDILVGLKGLGELS